jgi:hypothetical protein
MLPASLKTDLREHLKNVKRLHEEDLRAGNGRVYLPHALVPGLASCPFGSEKRFSPAQPDSFLNLPAGSARGLA